MLEREQCRSERGAENWFDVSAPDHFLCNRKKCESSEVIAETVPWTLPRPIAQQYAPRRIANHRDGDADTAMSGAMRRSPRRAEPNR